MSTASITDGQKTIVLPLPPETIRWMVAGTYATNNILDTSNPQVRRKFSASTFKLGRILLVSNGLNVDRYPIINTLTFWAKKQTKLKFNFNTYSIPICYISSIDVNVLQWNKNRPVHVEIDLDLLEGYPDIKPTKTTPAKKITPREQVKAKTKVKEKLKTPAKLASLKLADDYAVEVTELASVIITSNGETQEYDYDTFMESLG
jgi:hypothetical protein